MKLCSFALLFLLFSISQSSAGEADVVKVDVVNENGRTYRFNVTVSHDDTGWKHYADKWDVLAPDGSVLGTRTLLHPHVEEQPFTRSLSGVQVPEGITELLVRAHDLVHGYGGKVISVTLP